MVKGEQKKNHNRAITVLVLGMILSLFVMFNSGQYLLAAVLYLIMGGASILAYLIWDRF